MKESGPNEPVVLIRPAKEHYVIPSGALEARPSRWPRPSTPGVRSRQSQIARVEESLTGGGNDFRTHIPLCSRSRRIQRDPQRMSLRDSLLPANLCKVVRLSTVFPSEVAAHSVKFCRFQWSGVHFWLGTCLAGSVVPGRRTGTDASVHTTPFGDRSLPRSRTPLRLPRRSENGR